MGWSPEKQREYMREYNIRNRDKIKAYHREHYQLNRDRIRARQKAWEEANHERVKAYKLEWYHENKDPTKLATYRASRRSEARAANARYVLRHKARVMWNNMRKRALALGRPFELTIDLVSDMLLETTVCPILGIPLEHSTGQAKSNSPSFDCFYPERGYVPGNVNVISWRANVLKSSASVEEVRALLAWMEATTATIEGVKE